MIHGNTLGKDQPSLGRSTSTLGKHEILLMSRTGATGMRFLWNGQLVEFFREMPDSFFSQTTQLAFNS